MAGPNDVSNTTTDDVVFVDGIAMSPEEAQARVDAGTGTIDSTSDALRQIRQEEEEERLGVGGQVLAGVEGAARGLTFGLSDQLIATDDIAADDARRRREAFSGTAIAGEIGGGILGAIASGGTGAAGSIARLTPSGMAAARSAAFIGKGSTTAAKIGRAVIAEGVSGAAESAGRYLGKQAIENEEISATALGQQIVSGAILGGLAGGAGTALSAGAGKLGSALKSSDDIDLPIAKVVKGTPESLQKSKTELIDRIENARSRKVGDEVSDVINNPTLMRTTSGDDGKLIQKIEQNLDRKAREYARAAVAADEWSRRLAKIEPDKIDDAMDAEGIIHLARLDDARQDLDRTLYQIKSKYIDPNTTPLPTSVSVPVPVTQSVSPVQKIIQTGENVVAGLETAQDVGIDVPSVSQLAGGGIFGEALGAYARLKAGARAARKLGVLPSSNETRGASYVQAFRSRLDNVVSSTTSRTKNIAQKISTKWTPDRAASIARTIATKMRDNSAVDETHTRYGSLDPKLAQDIGSNATRAIQYLADTAPKNPLADSPYASKWKPSNAQAMEFGRRVDAITDPLDAIENVMNDPTSVIEAEVIKTVYPDIYAAVKNQIVTDMDQVMQKSRSQRLWIGAVFALPLDESQILGYSASSNIQPPTPEIPGSPRASTTSPLAQYDAVLDPHE